MRQVFKNRDGRLLGWADRSGARTTVRDQNGRLVGWYDIERNETRNRDGMLVGHGDILAALILAAP